LNQPAWENQARTRFQSVHDFDAVLRQHGCAPLARDSAPETLQINVGKHFNLMLELPIGAARAGSRLTIWSIDDLAELAGAPIATAPHCFGCTAGTGSGCGGALV